jgi:hypothetical protein
MRAITLKYRLQRALSPLRRRSRDFGTPVQRSRVTTVTPAGCAFS